MEEKEKFIKSHLSFLRSSSRIELSLPSSLPYLQSEEITFTSAERLANNKHRQERDLWAKTVRYIGHSDNFYQAKVEGGGGGEGYRERGSVPLVRSLELSRRTLQSTIIRRQAEWYISSANLPPLGDERGWNGF